jgi:hypothetical protein
LLPVGSSDIARPPPAAWRALLAHTRASGSAARPPGCQGASTAGARSRASAAPSFSRPLHRPGASIPAGTDEMCFVCHLLSHASWLAGCRGGQPQPVLDRGRDRGLLQLEDIWVANNTPTPMGWIARSEIYRSSSATTPGVRTSAMILPAGTRTAPPKHPSRRAAARSYGAMTWATTAPPFALRPRLSASGRLTPCRSAVRQPAVDSVGQHTLGQRPHALVRRTGFALRAGSPDRCRKEPDTWHNERRGQQRAALPLATDLAGNPRTEKAATDTGAYDR